MDKYGCLVHRFVGRILTIGGVGNQTKTKRRTTIKSNLKKKTKKPFQRNKKKNSCNNLCTTSSSKQNIENKNKKNKTKNDDNVTLILNSIRLTLGQNITLLLSYI